MGDTLQDPIRVLLADDDERVRALIADVLTSFGHDVVATASTGAEAIAHTATACPDVVLLDVHMPDGSGLDAARTIAVRHPDVAVILFTGDETLELSDRDAEESSAIAFLQKPTPPRVLDTQIRLAHQRARAMRDARGDAASARAALEERKLVERAKGVLMRRTGASEEEAFRILQRTSQDRSLPMVDIAKAVVNSEPPPRPRKRTR